MAVRFCFQFILLLVSCQLIVGFAEASELIHYTRIDKKIEVLGENSGFNEQSIFTGHFNKQDGHIELFPIGELEKITSIKRINPKNNLEIHGGLTIEEGVLNTSSFFDNQSIIQMLFNDTIQSVKYEINKHNSKLISLCGLELINSHNADTIHYELTIPNNLFLKYKIDSNLKFVKIDSIIFQGKKKYLITSTPTKAIKLKSRIHHFYEKKNDKFPILRIAIFPKKINNEWEYFNKWFIDLNSSNTNLSNKNKSLINSLISEKDNDEIKIKKAFEFVRDNIKYIAIENGIAAFQPRNPNKVIINKYGDCKDMANLLCQILIQYKIKANVALIATIDHYYSLDFPSLSSANHAICIAQTNKQTYFLDATNKTGSYNYPSNFTQGQWCYKTDPEKGELIQVPIIEPGHNSTIKKILLVEDSTNLKGNYQATFHCLNKEFYQEITQNYEHSESERKIQNYLQQQNPALKISDLKISSNDTIVNLNLTAQCNQSLQKNKDKNFILLKFLEFPHHYPQKITNGYVFMPYQTTKNELTYTIHFKKPIRIINERQFNPIQYGPLQFEFTIKQELSNEITISYKLEISKIKFDLEETLEYEKSNTEILKLLNTTIQYEYVADGK